MKRYYLVILIIIFPYFLCSLFAIQSISNLVEYPNCNNIKVIELDAEEILSKSSRYRFVREKDTLQAMYCLAKQIDNPELEAISLYKLGFEFNVESDDVNSLRQMMGYLDRSIAISTKHKYYQHLMAAKEILCTSFTSNKIYNQAMLYANEFLEVAQLINDSTKIAEGYMLLGRTHREQGNYAQGDSLLNLSLRYNTHTPEAYRIAAFSYLHLSNLYRLQKNYTKSIQYGNKGFLSADKAIDQVGFIKAVTALEVIQSNIELGLYENDELLDLIESHAINTKSTWMEAQFHFIKGTINERLNNITDAIKEYTLSFEYSLNTGENFQVLDISKKLLPLLLSQKGNEEEVKRIYEISQDVFDDVVDLNGLDNMFKVTYYKLQSEVVKSNYFESASKNYLNLLALSGGMIILLVLFAGSLYKQHLSRKKYNNELNALNEELAKSNRIVREKIEDIEAELKLKLITLSSIKNQIKNLEGSLKGSKDLSFDSKRRILNMLRLDKNIETTEAVNLKFLELNKSFVSKLTSKYPKLTNNDLKLCLYLKMNMSSKEIAQIQYKSVESIRVARSRLRKKLEINDKDYNLSSYLNSIEP